MNISLDVGQARFNYRVAAIITWKSQILLHSPSAFGFYALPGGRCEIMESSCDALKRELEEELGLLPERMSIRWTCENFFGFDNKPYHEIGFYYDVQFPQDAWIYRPGPIMGKESGKVMEFEWLPLAKLSSVDVRPSFIATELQKPAGELRHLIHRGV